MAVSIRLPTVLRSHAGGASTVEVEGTTLGEVFQTLIEQHPGLGGNLLAESGELHKFINVYVNDDDVRYLDKLDTKLEAGDTISILPAVAGG